MAQTLALAGLRGPAPQGPPEVSASGEVTVPGGPVTSAPTDPWAYDNERPAHLAELPPFRIDCALVTNADYAAFVTRTAIATVTSGVPRAGSGARRNERTGRSFGILAAPPNAPVQHVSFHEAEAYARWVGKRLLTEPEWEKAAKTVAAELEHMTGAVWQWTSSFFDGYPGFSAFPYAEYSEVFFGDEYRVLRGGSWLSDPLVARPTFRNWDLPQRRQIFSGLRCARDG